MKIKLHNSQRTKRYNNFCLYYPNIDLFSLFLNICWGFIDFIELKNTSKVPTHLVIKIEKIITDQQINGYYGKI